MRWTIQAKPDSQKVKQLSKDLGVDSIIATLLLQRGIETFEEAKDFFRSSLENLHNPFLM